MKDTGVSLRFQESPETRFAKQGFALRRKTSGTEKQPKHKVLGGMFLGHQGPRRRDIPVKNFMQVAFFCCFRQGVVGMSRDLGRDVPDLEKLYARTLWAVLSFPKTSKPLKTLPETLPETL